MQPSCARSTQGCLLLSLVLGCDRGTASPPGAFSGSGGTSQAGSSTSSGGQAGGSSTGGTGRRTTGAGGSGGRATGGASDAGGGTTGLGRDAGIADATSDSANTGSDDGGASDAGPADVRRPGRDGSDRSADTKNADDSADDGADDAETGTGVCDISDPPANVAAWIDESWNAEGRNNINWHKTWLADSSMKGEGEIDICVRYGATRSVSATTRDQVASAMQRWFSKWLALLYPCDCFPYPSVAVKVTGWAVKPGQESLLQWSDRTVPVYTEVSDGTDQAKGEPKCPDACGFFFHPDHVFTGCPGGADNHFDYTLWLDDTLPSGAAAEGSDWGVRMPVKSLMDEIDTDAYWVLLHEIGHGFGISDYYSWTGSKPAGGSIMMIGSSDGLTVGDQWMVRRYWKEIKALRY